MLDAIARPFGILMMWLYELTHNYFLSVILFSLIVTLIFLPFQMKSKKGMMRISLINPQLQELAKKYGSNKVKYNEEVQKLYREEGVNPMSGCIWTLIPFPVLIALYQAIRKPITIMMGVSESLLAEGGAIAEKLSQLGFEASSAGYVQIEQAKFISEHFSEFEGISDKLQQINYSSFGLDLGAVPQWQLWTFDWSDSSKWLPAVGLFLIPILATLISFISVKISQKMNPQPQTADGAAPATGNGMIFVTSLMTLFFAFAMPAALGVYWIANSTFNTIRDIYLTKRYKKIIAAEKAVRDEARMKKQAEIEAKRKETERLKENNATVQSENTSKKKQQALKKQAKAEKALEWQRSKGIVPEKSNPSQVGDRPYARGRSYDPERFAANGVIGATSNTSRFDKILEASGFNPASAGEEAADSGSSGDVNALPEASAPFENTSEENNIAPTDNLQGDKND